MTAPDEVQRALSYVEEQFDLGDGFLIRLYREDDWSFVIKAHALVEGAISQLLVKQLGDERIARPMDRLGQTSRVAFV